MVTLDCRPDINISSSLLPPLFPAATGRHAALAWWSFLFLGRCEGGLQSGSTAGSQQLPLLLLGTLAVRSKRAQREHGGVRENTNRAPIVPRTWVQTPLRPTSRGLRPERMSGRQWCFVNTLPFSLQTGLFRCQREICLLCSLRVSLPFLSPLRGRVWESHSRSVRMSSAQLPAPLRRGLTAETSEQAGGQGRPAE